MPSSRLARVQKSTIVRSFSLLERAAPGLGAWWAERLWFAVPRAHGPRDRLAGPGRPFRVDVGGHAVRGEIWGEDPAAPGNPARPGIPVTPASLDDPDSRPTAYLVHGWGGWRGQLDGFVGPLVGAGWRVVAFDAPGHGDSDPGPEGPGRATILDFAGALAAVVAANGPAAAVVAHSLGATAAALAIDRGLAVGRAVFLAPMADPLPYTRTFAARLGFGERVRVRLVHRIERRVGLPMAAFDVPGIASRVATPPLLLVHDRQDAETGWSDSAAIARAWPRARLVTTGGLGHRRVLRAPAVIAEVAGFLTGAVAAAPEPAAPAPA